MAALSNTKDFKEYFIIVQMIVKDEGNWYFAVLKVHINRIQLYLYSMSPRNQYKLKP